MSIEKKGQKHRDFWHISQAKSCQEYLNEMKQTNLFKANDVDLFYLKVGANGNIIPSYYVLPGITEVLRMFRTKEDHMRSIVNSVVKITDVTYQEIMGKSRKRKIVDARYLCIAVILDVVPIGVAALGKFFNKDHSTMIHAKRKYADLMGLYPDEYLYKYTLITDLYKRRK